MEAILDYLAMDGYWPFIWPAYGTAAIVLLSLLASTLRSVRSSEAALAELDRLRPRRRQQPKPAGETLNDA